MVVADRKSAEQIIRPAKILPSSLVIAGHMQPLIIIYKLKRGLRRIK